MDRGRRHQPVPLKETLGAVAADLRTAAPDALATLASQWVDVVGLQLAAHARPGGLVDGTLTVLVDDPAVASVFRQRSGTLARRWSELLGNGVVRELRVLVERPGGAPRS